MSSLKSNCLAVLVLFSFSSTDWTTAAKSGLLETGNESEFPAEDFLGLSERSRVLISCLPEDFLFSSNKSFLFFKTGLRLSDGIGIRLASLPMACWRECLRRCLGVVMDSQVASSLLPPLTKFRFVGCDRRSSTLCCKVASAVFWSMLSPSRENKVDAFNLSFGSSPVLWPRVLHDTGLKSASTRTFSNSPTFGNDGHRNGFTRDSRGCELDLHKGPALKLSNISSRSLP